MADPTIQREFIGWQQPALPEVAQRLRQRYGRGSILDLGQVIVVVPGQRAGRRLQELLAFRAEDDGLRLTPPQVITEGRLPELLYTPKFPFANELVQDLAWAQALRDLPSIIREQVVPRPPESTLGWLELGKVLRQLHLELAADGLEFAAVHQNGPTLADFQETERWQALAEVQRRYLLLLDAQELWDIQTARLVAIQKREICTDCDIILVGTVDLNNSLRQMLDQVAGRVTAYIAAPENLAERFDAHGCLIPAAWCAATIALPDEQIRQVDGSADQVDAVTDWLAKVAGHYRSDEVAIGVPDEALVPQVQRQLDMCGVRGRWVEGVRLAEMGPFSLLAVAVQFAGSQRYEDLASLARHPDLEEWLERSPGRRNRKGVVEERALLALSFSAQLDRYYNTHLPSRLRARDLHRDPRRWPDLPAVLERIEGWLCEAAEKRPLRSWGECFREILGQVYGARTLQLDIPADEVLHRTIKALMEACEQLDSLPETLDGEPVTAADAFQAALGPLAETALPPPADPQAVEILGWLELPLDDSRALIVTTFNEGFVPKSAGADAFLPDRLRCELGLLHNERRYARDAYALSVLAESRRELRILSARRDTNNDPLQPSRLLFACPDETLIRRAQTFFARRGAAVAPRRLLFVEGRGLFDDHSSFNIPRPAKTGQRLKRMPVTRFKAYLACPYRYYLRYVRKLTAVDDAARELGGGSFGSLLHRVLEKFGRDPDGPWHSEHEQEIANYLIEQLLRLARLTYGPDRHRPAIRIQLEQARRRLTAFAMHQAALVSQGWRMVHSEDAEGAQGDISAEFAVPGDELIQLVGRIDRIDFHEKNKAYRILDYKTGDNVSDPERTHRSASGWIDLQLPLYRHFLPPKFQQYRIELAYFNLPKKLEETGVRTADWDDASLESADETAQKIIRNLRAGVYSPLAAPPAYGDDFAAICMSNVLRPPTLSDDGDGGRP